jgi:hypothetical protein
MVALSSEIVTIQATAVRTLGGLRCPHWRGKNTIDSTLCRVS